MASRGSTGPVLPLRTVFPSVPKPGQHSELHVWPAELARGGRPKVVLVFVPGNPGFVSYYTSFLDQIHKSFRSSVEILAISQTGHVPLSISTTTSSLYPPPFISSISSIFRNWVSGGERLPGLDDQVKDKEEFFRWIQKKYGLDDSEQFTSDRAVPNGDTSFSNGTNTAEEANSSSTEPAPKLVVITHSIGSWIAPRAAQRVFRPSSVPSFYFLYPTIFNMHLTSNARRLSFLIGQSRKPSSPSSSRTSSSSYYQRSATLIESFIPILFIPLICHLLLSHLPLSLISFLVRIVTGQKSREAKETTSELIQNGEAVACSCGMGFEEMRRVRGPEDIGNGMLTSLNVLKDESMTDWLSFNRNKLSFYWAEGERDGWVRAVDREMIGRFVGTKENGSVLLNDDDRMVERDKDDWKERESRLGSRLGGSGPRRWVECEEKTVHAFCLEHSDIIAKRCIEWINEDFFASKK